MKKITLAILMLFSLSFINAQTTSINVNSEDAVEKFLLKNHVWSCPDAGKYELFFTYDYYSQYNTYALIFWTLDRNDPVGVFSNVSFDPGSYCTIKGTDALTGKDVSVDLYKDGHCMSGGNYFSKIK